MASIVDIRYLDVEHVFDTLRSFPISVGSQSGLWSWSFSVSGYCIVLQESRTGSGKSSFLALLLKLLYPLPSSGNNHDQEPSILIDNTPLHRIHRATLRQRLIAVPQDPIFLPDGSSFRANLDPTNTATPAECQRVLEAVRLLGFVQERAEGLYAAITAGTLSAGQRQLFSLGRAVLRAAIRLRSTTSFPWEGSDNQDQRVILLLDEVSSSVDRETEQMMQEIIRAEFRHYTVIAESHRLETIMDFDRVVVMDRGEVVEVGNPAILKRGSWESIWGVGGRCWCVAAISPTSVQY